MPEQPGREDARRAIPRTDHLLRDPRIAPHVATLGAGPVKSVIGAAQALARAGELAPGGVAAEVAAQLDERERLPTSLRDVINATGVVVHTNLGRAPLSTAAVRAVTEAAGYVDVEFDLPTGVRARRGRATLQALRARVPEAEAALVVNNGAAALSLAATVLAQGGEVVVSRGELVEIGDGFRLPDLIESTGVSIREVGTTNRTSLSDYTAAIGPATGAVLKIHPSNFRMTGFTSSVGVAELASALQPQGIPLVVDLGSGLLAPDAVLPDEPDAATTLRAGADLVTASGDKLLGGPQAGLVLGRSDLVERLRRHPLARAFRVDKLTLAALEATVCGPVPPVVRALHADAEELRRRATDLRDAVLSALSGYAAELVPVDGAVGGGGGPGVPLPGWAVSLPEGLAERLRLGSPPVVARIEGGHTLVDLRCVPADRDAEVASAIVAAAGGAGVHRNADGAG